MEKKRLQDVTDYKVMSFKEACDHLNWKLPMSPFGDIVGNCGCGCELKFRMILGRNYLMCPKCGRYIVNIFSPVCEEVKQRTPLDANDFNFEKDANGCDRFWIAKFDGFDHGGIVTDKTKVEENRVIPKAAFVQKPLDEGITIEEITELVGRLECEQVIPIEVQANSSCAIGFISLDAAEELDYDYDNLIRNVSEVIEDMDNETEYGNYDFDGFPVYIGY